ncbi:MAG: L,D-transpeptidase [Muribaculaceae bacterium]|nr:L,D-transpeptidase [Muribaculaceae bacterium]
MKSIKRLQTAAVSAALLCCLSCGGNKSDVAVASEQAPVETTAEITATDGTTTYRPDTARIFHRDAIDREKTFIVISKKELRLSVYADLNGDTTLIARYPVCLSRNKGQKEGTGDMKTPESEPGKPFHIKQIQDASDWTHDFGDGRGSIRAYGNWFMRLETPFTGIGIHGSTNNEDKLPGRDSEGCIRLRDSDLDHLHDNYAHVGMPVIIKGETQGDLPFEAKARKNDGQKL